jgi:hypothetical protein
MERHAHWETVYQTKGDHEVSWFEESPAISLELTLEEIQAFMRGTGKSAPKEHEHD